VDLIVANSVGTSWAFQEAGFTKIIVAHNGVDLAHFFTDEGRENARHLLGLPGGKRIVCYSGSFYRWKGVPLLLEAWKKQCALRDDLLLVLVGGTKADLVREGAGDDAVSIGNLLLVSHQGAAKVPSYLRAADLLVLPTAPVSREAIAFTSPIKLFEYMASGRPIVAADLPSIREVVSEHEVAFARAGDADDWSRVLVELLGDPRRGEQLAGNAREKAKGYDWESRMRMISEEVKRASIA
jgi:glycosyltransferase involved in cell wall biosynthesis